MCREAVRQLAQCGFAFRLGAPNSLPSHLMLAVPYPVGREFKRDGGKPRGMFAKYGTIRARCQGKNFRLAPTAESPFAPLSHPLLRAAFGSLRSVSILGIWVARAWGLEISGGRGGRVAWGDRAGHGMVAARLGFAGRRQADHAAACPLAFGRIRRYNGDIGQMMGIVPKARNNWEGMAMTNSWSALKEVRANARKDDGRDYFRKAVRFVEDGKHAGDMGHYDFESARRHMGYALYQVERLYNLRNGRG